MNPRSVNSTNVINFGFKTVLDLELRTLLFDITGLTTFNPGGAAAITGISFEVIDPAGVPIHTVQFAPPDIDPDVLSTYELDLPSGIALFGTYLIKGVLREANGTDYEVVLPPKEVCEPKDFEDDVVCGKFKETVDCTAPFIRLNEITNFIYLGKAPVTKTKVGNLYHPLGTVNAEPFTHTPFQTSQVYTGDHVVRNKSIADYDLQDYFYVRIGYETNYKFPVTCMSRLCDIMCCIEDQQRIAKENCNNAKGTRAKKLLDEITIPLFMATAKEKCGKSANEEIELIKKILNCDCNDCNSHPVEPTPVQDGSGNVLVFEGECAATVTPETEGNTTTVTTKVKNVIVRNSTPADPAFEITRQEDECNIYWTLLLNYEALATNIYNETQNNQTLLNLFNSLVVTTGIGAAIAGLNGKCVIDLSQCDYEADIAVSYNTATPVSIVINGVTYPAPGGLLFTAPLGIQAWLNSLALGVWTVSWTPLMVPPGGTLSIVSNGNTHTIGTFQHGGSPVVGEEDTVFAASFDSDCKTLKEILQAIIDYLCALTTLQIKTGLELQTCSINNLNQVVPTSYGPLYNLGAYLEQVGNALCNLANKVTGIIQLNCAQVTGVFPVSAETILIGDYVLGTKNGSCARLTIKDLAIAIFTYANTDIDIKNVFCAIDCGDINPSCFLISDFDVETSAS